MRSNRGISLTHERLLLGLATVGALVLAVGVAVDPDRIWGNLLVGAFFLLSLSLGGAVFVALANVTGAGWHTAFRRVPEAMARMLPTTGFVMLVVLALRIDEYGWHHHGEGGAGTFWFKQWWLTPTFWMLRAAGYVVVWWFLAGRLLAISRQQDTSSDRRLSDAARRVSAAFLAVLAVTLSLAAVDWFMALEPMWFSTMWGVYHFSGMVQAALATMILVGLVLRSHNGPLSGIFNDEHLHDLGKLLLGFCCFWMYIWFSQYMLIWYSNIPEETFYFVSRTSGAWGPLMVLNLVLNWGVPFFVLLPKPAKRNASVMAKIAVVALAGRLVDLYLMVFPVTAGESPVFNIWEAALLCVIVGAGGLLVFRAFGKAAPVPAGDPYLGESVGYHN